MKTVMASYRRVCSGVPQNARAAAIACILLLQPDLNNNTLHYAFETIKFAQFYRHINNFMNGSKRFESLNAQK